MRLIPTLALCLLPSLAAAQPPSAQLLHTFTPSPARPIGGLVQIPDGSFYGVTDDGIIRVASNGAVTLVARFRDGTPSGPLARASDGALYGVTSDGGPSNRGTIFRFDPASGIVRVVHGFAAPTEGTNPVGGLVRVGGSLYGVTRSGPQGGLGTMFHLVVATGAVITDAIFPDSLGVSLAEVLYAPSGPPTPGPDGRLYGVTTGAGTIALYAFDPGTRAIAPAHVIPSHEGAGDTIAFPLPLPLTLTLGPDGSLYGSAPSGGFDRAGSIYRYTPATDRFELLYRLSPWNGQDGRSPGPLLAASDGHFYGVTSRRSDESPGGTVFRFRAGAGGTFTYEPLMLLDPSVAGAPTHSALTQGADGLIYGSARAGGPTDTGTLFRFDPAAGGPPSNPLAFTVRHTFPFVTAWGPSVPVPAADAFLYGLTSYGGATNRGAAYRLSPATGAVTILDPIPGTGLATQAVNSSLVPGPAGLLYGLSTVFTPGASVTNIVRLDPATGAVTVAAGDVGRPAWVNASAEVMPPLVATPSGQLFGVRYERLDFTNRIYRFDPATHTVSDVAVLPAFGGSSNLVARANGDVVGLKIFVDESYDWSSTLVRLNAGMASGFEQRRLVPDVFSIYSNVVEGPDGLLYFVGKPGEAVQAAVLRLDPGTGIVSATCAGVGYYLTPGGDGALYGIGRSLEAQARVRCDPATGAFTTAALPAGVGEVWAPMARLGTVFYGASRESGLAPRARAGGTLFRVAAAGTTLPLSDTDGDSLPDIWETAYGLDPSDAGSGSGAADDPDGDGRSNAQELAEGTHPRGFVTRLFAEGATNAFFRTRFDLANPGLGDATVLARFLTDRGATIATEFTVPSFGHLGVEAYTVVGLPSGSFSSVFESDRPIAVDRSMSWDMSGYGSHLETGIAAPSTTWYLAEGSTSGEFSLFYLLQNPQASTVTATVRYLRPSGQPPIDRTYVLPPASRTTIAVDAQGAELTSTDVSAVITATAPIVAERAMYVNRPRQPFAAGHESAGVTAPAIDWFLAEGATGAFFDLFVLIANPSTTAAHVSVEYLRSSGPPLVKTYVVPAESRLTIWVDDEELPAGSGQKPLAQGSVSTAVHVTNGVPIIVERAMWWPGPETTTNFWYEAHNSPGATGAAMRWLIAGAELGGWDAAEAYVLIANTADRPGRVRLAVLYDGPRSSLEGYRVLDLAPKSRTTARLRDLVGGQAPSGWFGLLVESDPAAPVPIVVERATYASPGGVFWGRGGNALATPLP
jgi:uncharacterized repeat protein (TIGR03803 family)